MQPVAPLLASLLLLPTLAASTPLQQLVESELQLGGGCSYYIPLAAKDKGKLILAWPHPGKAFLRLEGKLLRASVIHRLSTAQRQPDYHPKIGDEHVTFLSSGPVTVRVVEKVVAACAVDNDSCESIQYNAKIEVRTPKGKSSLEAWGICGS